MPPPTTPAAVAAPLPDPLPNWFPARPPTPAPTRVPQPLSSSPTTLMIAIIRIAYSLADRSLAGASEQRGRSICSSPRFPLLPVPCSTHLFQSRRLCCTHQAERPLP